MNFVEHSERIIRHSCNDIDLCEIEPGRERLWFENSDSLELIGSLPIKGGSGEDETFLEAKSGLIKWAIVSHDVVPLSVSTERIFNRLCDLCHRLASGLHVTIAFEIYLGDEIPRVY